MSQESLLEDIRNLLGGVSIVTASVGTLTRASGTAAAVNVATIGGTTISTGGGTIDAGTQRVVLASDQTALTINLPVDLKKIGTTAVDSNSGVKSAGTQRTVLATDQPALTTMFPAAAALSDSASNPTTTTLGSASLIYDSINNQWVRWRMASPNIGGVPMVTVEQTMRTASAAAIGLVADNAATDIFTLTTAGATPGNVRIRRITISGTSTAGGACPVQILVRSTADTGGTATNPTVLAWNGSVSGITAPTIAAYTANPAALGTLIAILAADTLRLGKADGTVVGDTLTFDFGDNFAAYSTSGATSQVIAINLNAATYAGNSLQVTYYWTQDNLS